MLQIHRCPLGDNWLQIGCSTEVVAERVGDRITGYVSQVA